MFIFMEVKKENIRKDTTSCNFCNRGELNKYHNGLIYPYEEVITFKREGNGIVASICKQCLDELIKKAGSLNVA
jgi:hypothetical protein